jgi:putative FmdB family regulatory protein
MPTYEYECGQCNYRFDMRQGFDDEPQAVCPECHGKARRVFHPAPIIYRGSGFYVTDSRKNSTPEGSSGGSKSGESKSGESKSSESKTSETKVSD